MKVDVYESTEYYDELTESVREFARKHDYEASHSEHVLKLASEIYQQLKGLFRLNEDDLFLLKNAAIVHDLGWVEGKKGHHKHSMQIVMDDESLPLSGDDRKLIALIARYHRKALPSDDHPIYKDLPEKQKHKIGILGGILRIADGLDRSHLSLIEQLKIENEAGFLIFKCKSSSGVTVEIGAAEKKSDLLEKTTGLKCVFKCFRP